ncbi:unnamed protein product, partial [Brachionus calyciflorus]
VKLATHNYINQLPKAENYLIYIDNC